MSENKIESLSETVQRMEAEKRTIDYLLALFYNKQTELIVRINGSEVVLQTKPFLKIHANHLTPPDKKPSEISHELFVDCFVSGLRDKATNLSTQLREMSEVLTKI
jgi:hypothetical protein